MKRIPSGENPKPEFGASLLRFSSESTESNESGRSPGSSDFSRPSHPLLSAGAEKDNGLLDKSFFRLLGQTYSCGDSSGITPDSLLIPGG